MPQKIFMVISNGNQFQQFSKSLSQGSSSGVIASFPVQNTSLSSGMIARIYNAKAGCGSCGK